MVQQALCRVATGFLLALQSRHFTLIVAHRAHHILTILLLLLRLQVVQLFLSLQEGALSLNERLAARGWCLLTSRNGNSTDYVHQVL